MSLNNRYNPAAFSDEEDDDDMGTVATPMYPDPVIVKLRFCFLPKTCQLSGKKLWLTKAYKISQTYRARPGFPEKVITYTHWADQAQYIIWKLKNE